MSMSMIAPSIATSSGYDANSGRLILNSMQSTRSMEPDTVSPTNRESDHSLRWSGRFSLTRRILAVNILALVLLAGGFFYLDSYRTGLLTRDWNRSEAHTSELQSLMRTTEAVFCLKKIKNINLHYLLQ